MAIGFPIRIILAMFDLQVTPILPTKFQVNQPFGSPEEVQNIFSRWQTWQPFFISDPNNFSFFFNYKLP